MRTKTSLAGGVRPPIDTPTAWACTFTNAVTLPGLGTVAGRHRIGYAQAVLALVGFGATMIGAVGMIRDWLQAGELPLEITRSLAVATIGIAIYACAWLWAMASSVSLHREARRASAPAIQDTRTDPPRLPPRSRSHS